MTVGEIRELLKNFEDDWDIKLVESTGFRGNDFDVVDILDVGHSDRTVLIEIVEDE